MKFAVERITVSDFSKHRGGEGGGRGSFPGDPMGEAVWPALEEGSVLVFLGVLWLLMGSIFKLSQ